jgi:predicted nucleic acid-binding protein
MIVVADTGPINYLIAIAHIELLPKLYGRILVPDSVCDELQKDAAPKVVRQWMAKPPAWLEIRTPTIVPDAALLGVRIGPGERDAILLAEESGADELIIDDLRGRREAERRRLHAIGTLGVLRVASKRRFLNLRDALTSLRATNFYIDQELFDRLVAEAEQ